VAVVTDDAAAVIEEIVADKGYQPNDRARSGDAGDSHLHQRARPRAVVVARSRSRTRKHERAMTIVEVL
jgi:hypothetical protein